MYLLGLKKGLRDDFNHLGNWNSSDQTPCLWSGVSCTSEINPVVYSLQLRGMNLLGNLSSSIGGLGFLTYLDISHSAFSGTIPKEIANCKLSLFI